MWVHGRFWSSCSYGWIVAAKLCLQLQWGLWQEQEETRMSWWTGSCCSCCCTCSCNWGAGNAGRIEQLGPAKRWHCNALQLTNQLLHLSSNHPKFTLLPPHPTSLALGGDMYILYTYYIGDHYWSFVTANYKLVWPVFLMMRWVKNTMTCFEINSQLHEPKTLFCWAVGIIRQVVSTWQITGQFSPKSEQNMWEPIQASVVQLQRIRRTAVANCCVVTGACCKPCRPDTPDSTAATCHLPTT